MCCVVNHCVLQAQNASSTTKEKGCLIYNKDHGTTTMKKHIVSNNHDCKDNKHVLATMWSLQGWKCNAKIIPSRSSSI
jgi:hypothetical protein